MSQVSYHITTDDVKALIAEGEGILEPAPSMHPSVLHLLDGRSYTCTDGMNWWLDTDGCGCVLPEQSCAVCREVGDV